MPNLIQEEELFEPSKLKEEIDSWIPFLKFLASEDRQLFKDMIEKAWNYSDSIETCQPERTTEAFLLSLLVSEQRTINSLSSQIQIMREQSADAGQRID